MTFQLLPYLMLLCAIVAAWLSSVQVSLILLTGAVVAGLSTGALTWLALPSIITLGLLLWWPRRYPAPPFLKAVYYALFLGLALAMLKSSLPGFNNLPIYQDVRFSPDTIPFSMSLNFEGALVGLFIILFFTRTSIHDFKARSLLTSLTLLAILAAVIFPVAFAMDYVRADLKFPPWGWIWILNNLFFVCVAEEGLFRGFIQKWLQALLPPTKACAVISLVTASLLFGIAHYKGGPVLMTMAAIAGGFFGWAFQKTGRLEAAIAVHFGLNLVHFLFFSYPALLH